MTYLMRDIQKQMAAKMFKGKALLLFGARQVGKTSLVNALIHEFGEKHLILNGDDADIRELLQKPNLSSIKRIVGSARILLIDEAQRIPDIGLVLKIIVDRHPELQVVATGSSSFELMHSIQEPLTGRAWQWQLHPFSFAELSQHFSLLEEKRALHTRLIYGSYPEVVLQAGAEADILRLLSGAYLYRDIQNLPTVGYALLLEKIARALALQIGNEVNTRELGQLVGADRLTVEKYLRILEQAFIIFQLPALNRNVRNEIKLGRKIYFYDTGIRNAIIHNFSNVHSRTDMGALWENYCISERLKLSLAQAQEPEFYFWRTTQQQEIDLIEEPEPGILHAFEFKWNPRKHGRFSKTFAKAYPGSSMETISPENYDAFLLP